MTIKERKKQIFIVLKNTTSGSFTTLTSASVAVSGGTAGWVTVTGENVTGGNAYLTLTAAGVQGYSLGVRHSSTDLVLNSGGALAATDLITVSNTGSVSLIGPLNVGPGTSTFSLGNAGQLTLIASQTTSDTPLEISNSAQRWQWRLNGIDGQMRLCDVTNGKVPIKVVASTQAIVLTGSLAIGGAISTTDTTSSTSTTTGSGKFAGGVGIVENLNVGGFIQINATTAATAVNTGALKSANFGFSGALGDPCFIGGSLQTGAPIGGTAAAWKHGIYVAGAPTVTGYIQLDVGGVLYKVAAST
jgi:hypothetical protein